MKTLHIIGLSAIALLSSCDQDKITMNTVIHSDGTCQREIAFHADSASLVNPSETCGTYVLGVLDDDAWSKTWHYRNDSLSGQYPMTTEQYNAVKADHTENCHYSHGVEQEILIRGKRSFQSVKEMAEAFPIYMYGKQVSVTAKLDKQFHWLYTDYVYTESYDSFASQFAIPLSRFMSNEEMSYFLTGTPDLIAGNTPLEGKAELDRLEEQFFKFINLNMIHDQFKLISEHYDLIPKAPYTREEFEQFGQKILANDKAFGYNPVSVAGDIMFQKALEGTPEIKEIYDRKSWEVYTNALESIPELNNLWQQQSSIYAYLVAYEVDYHLMMPGTVDLSGCSLATYSDGVLTYHINGLRLLAPEYTIQAASRERNLWAIILSALIGLAAIVLCVMKKK